MEDFPTVTVGGAGGIGSWLTFFLGRIGVPMDIYEMDNVDYTNMGGQLFREDQIGNSKFAAVSRNIQDYSAPLLLNNFGRFCRNMTVQPITFSAFDNMNARRDMARTWFKQHGEFQKLSTPTIFIDGRMTVESFQIFAVTPDRFHEYMDKHIFDDSLISDPICSMKATSHIGGMIGSMMTQLFTNYITNHDCGFDLRDLPFHKQYETSFLDFL